MEELEATQEDRIGDEDKYEDVTMLFPADPNIKVTHFTNLELN